MAHQYSRVGFKSSVEVNEVNLSLSYGGVLDPYGVLCNQLVTLQVLGFSQGEEFLEAQ